MSTLRSLKRGLALAGLSLVFYFSAMGSAQAAGLLKPINAQAEALDITQHHVEVTIEDGYAVTEVEQVFANPNTQDLEAIYSFPLPEKGVVSEFTVWIDGQPVTGEVLKKQRAQQIYEQEKSAGRDAGLMQKDSHKTFDIQVSPVRAQQQTRVRFVYLQPAHLDTGMGRYVYPLEEGGVDARKLAFWTADAAVKENFSFNFKLRSAYPVAAVRMPNQSAARVEQDSAREWRVSLQSGQANVAADDASALDATPTRPATATMPTTAAFNLDQDLVVYWRLQDGLPGSVDMVSYRAPGASRGTFMLTLTPGDDLQVIEQGSDWVFVLDISGSMKGKYATLVDGVERALGKMRGDDRFRLVLFNESAQELTSGYVAATPDNIRHYADALLQVQPGQGTNLYEGLKRGLKTLDDDRTSAIILVTDGVANVGETRQRQFIDLLKQRDIRLFTFVMGNSANRPLLDSLTRASNGFAISVSNSDDMIGKILEAQSKVTHQALHGVDVTINGVRTADLTPAKIGSLYRGQQLIVLGHYWGQGVAELRLRGEISGQQTSYSTTLEFAAEGTADESGNPELERLWAYASIEAMQQEMADFGQNADIEQAITDLSLEYGLVTDYTSMIVLRDEVFQQHGIERRHAKRVADETAAKAQRAQQAPKVTRVDTAQPMFAGNRPSHSGGSGTFGPWSLLCLLGLAIAARRLGR